MRPSNLSKRRALGASGSRAPGRLDISSGTGLSAAQRTLRLGRLDRNGPFGRNLVVQPRPGEGPLTTCAVTRRRFSVGASPTRRFAPAGSNRSRHGGDEMSEAFG